MQTKNHKITDPSQINKHKYHPNTKSRYPYEWNNLGTHTHTNNWNNAYPKFVTIEVISAQYHSQQNKTKHYTPNYFKHDN